MTTATGRLRLGQPRGSAGGSEGWLFYAAAAVAGFLLIVLIARTGAIATATENNSDLAAPIVVAKTAHQYSHAQIITGRLGWWGPLWLLELFRSTPLSGFFDTAAPVVLAILVPLLVAVQAWRLWGATAAVTVALMALSVGGATWAAGLGGWSVHAPVWWTGGFVALWSVWLAGIADLRRGVAAAVVGLVLAALIGIVGSGDQLMLAAAEIPLAVGGLYLLSHRRWLHAAGLLLVAALGLAATGIVASIARDHALLRQVIPITSLPFEQLGTSFSNTLLALESVWQGPVPLPGHGYDLLTNIGALAGYLGAFLVVVAVAGVAVAIVRWAATVWSREPRRLLPVLAPGPELQRGAWIAVWGTMLIAYLAAFGGTSVQGALGNPISRYLYGVPLAAGAMLAPVIASRRPWPTVALALGLALVAAIGLIARSPWSPNLQTDVSRSQLFARIKTVAAQQHLTRGFASYWISYPLTISSNYKLDVRPAGACIKPVGWVCTMYLNYIDQAYAYHPDTRSFLLVDNSPAAHIPYPPAEIITPPVNVKPQQVIPIGDGITMEIFSTDFARYMRGDYNLGDPRLFRGGPLPPS
ncbi:MAG: hypothetical protein WAK93_00420 [Solirubrobacteraceae bacterium]